MKLRRSGFGDLQDRADARRRDLEALEREVTRRVEVYLRHPSPHHHAMIVRAVRSLRIAEEGRR